MSKMRYFNTRFWSDPWVVDALNPLDRHLFIYLITNEHTTISGVYEISLRTISNETGIEKEEVVKMLKRLEPKVFYIEGWIVLVNGIKNQNYRSPKVQAGIKAQLATIPPATLKAIKLPENYNDVLPKTVVSTPTKNTVPNRMDTVSHLDRDRDLDRDINTKDTNVSLLPPDQLAATVRKTKTVEIDALFASWKDTVGYEITSQMKSNRDYASRLLKEYAIEDIQKMLLGVAMSLEDQYAPRISNFIQLYRKWDDLKAWGRRSMRSKQTEGGIRL